MVYKVVFHINLPDEGALNRALGNVANLLKGIGDKEHDVVVLLNGQSVSLIAGDNSLPFQVRITELHRQGVHFKTCRNSLKKAEVDPASLPPEFDIVPAGIIAIIELQNDGFAYVKP
ncbi:MAG: DsrE family protein [Proteobacteria bacterium]|nr:DsrE family protein [Pseudomonadota bacterium]MBU1640756.1 DsrE family protein [Pseudomonadota bacterium]